uniref:Talin N-terminal F0 domain-containing protein n=1 Tax=Accipiter nisus TaxID=211598 RepID=A0A8B9N6V8_9AVES
MRGPGARVPSSMSWGRDAGGGGNRGGRERGPGVPCRAEPSRPAAPRTQAHARREAAGREAGGAVPLRSAPYSLGGAAALLLPAHSSGDSPAATMVALSLKISIGNVVKTMQFEPSTMVYDACRMIRERVPEAQMGQRKYTVGLAAMTGPPQLRSWHFIGLPFLFPLVSLCPSGLSQSGGGG